MPARRTPLAIASVLIALTLSCGGETSILLHIDGNYPSAAKLSIRLVGDQGPLPDTYTFPQSGPLNIPGSVLIKTGSGHIGVFMWAEDAMGRPVAWARSNNCMPVSSGVQSKYSIGLQPATGTFSPNEVNGCFCDKTNPTMTNMCPPGGVPPVGGSGGGSPLGGAGGVTPIAGSSGAGDGGVAGAGGGAGVAIADGGVAGASGGAGAGGGVDAAPVMPGNSNDIWGFETAGWAVTPAVAGVTVMQDADAKQGTKSLLVMGPQTDSNVKIVSPPFTNAGAATAKIGIWVWLDPPAEFYSYLELRALCGPTDKDVYFGGQPVNTLPKKTWTRVTFPVPNYAPEELKASCKMSVGINGMRGSVKLDGIAFDP